jgi:hypothetical protein
VREEEVRSPFANDHAALHQIVLAADDVERLVARRLHRSEVLLHRGQRRRELLRGRLEAVDPDRQRRDGGGLPLDRRVEVRDHRLIARELLLKGDVVLVRLRELCRGGASAGDQGIDARHDDFAILDLARERIELGVGALVLRQALHRGHAAVDVHDEVVGLEDDARQRVLLCRELRRELRGGGGALCGEHDGGAVGTLVFSGRATGGERERGRGGERWEACTDHLRLVVKRADKREIHGRACRPLALVCG